MRLNSGTLGLSGSFNKCPTLNVLLTGYLGELLVALTQGFGGRQSHSLSVLTSHADIPSFSLVGFAPLRRRLLKCLSGGFMDKSVSIFECVVPWVAVKRDFQLTLVLRLTYTSRGSFAHRQIAVATRGLPNHLLHLLLLRVDVSRLGHIRHLSHEAWGK